jgi:UDP-N-acetylmuramate dehydrogenase
MIVRDYILKTFSHAGVEFMTDFYREAVKITGETGIKRNEELSRYTTFKIGGVADYIAEPENADQIKGLIALCRRCNMPYFILGNGSNILVSDKGYRGLIIHILSGMNDIRVEDTRILAQAGASLIKVSKTAKENGLTGMEFASGIPGSVGGAVYMNAGAYGGELKHVVSSVKVMNSNGDIYDVACEDMDFSYRHSIVEEQELIVLEAVFELKKGNAEEIGSEMRRLAEARVAKQPLEFPSAGSTFKRPEGHFAGKLIMDAGLRGASVGGARVSDKHCGFVINTGGATAEDVIGLVEYVQQTVYKKDGIMLELEVKKLGEF